MENVPAEIGDERNDDDDDDDDGLPRPRCRAVRRNKRSRFHY